MQQQQQQEEKATAAGTAVKIQFQLDSVSIDKVKSWELLAHANRFVAFTFKLISKVLPPARAGVTHLRQLLLCEHRVSQALEIYI